MMIKVKICGLQTAEQVMVAENSGADYLGFVFAKSKRQVSPIQVKDITKNLSPSIKKVGVFVSPNLNELVEIIQTAQLDMIQLHGDLSQHLVSILKTNFFKEQQVEIIQAFSGEETQLTKSLNQSFADFVLLDSPSHGKKYAGGNGLTFDWEQASKKISETNRERLMIAGGLTKENVKRACDIFKPFAVDVSSGVETNGVKDLQKMTDFIKSVKEEYYV